MEFLLDTLKKGKDDNIDDGFIGPCCKAGWEKLEKYYTLTNQSPAYIAAIVVCPQYKWDFFTRLGWKPKWIESSYIKVQNLWDSKYKGVQLPKLPQPSQIGVAESNPRRENAFHKWQTQH
jgi:hypothetical protein